MTKEKNSGVKICLISSHGGHLRELLDATNSVNGAKYYVTCRTDHTVQLLQDEPHYFVIDPHLSFWKYFVNTAQSLDSPTDTDNWILLADV